MGDQIKSKSTFSNYKGCSTTSRTVRVFFEAFNDYGEIAVIGFALFYNAMMYIDCGWGVSHPPLWLLSVASYGY